MATTGYSSTGAYLDTGYGIARIHGDIVYNVTRTNNTVYFTGTYARVKYVRESGGWTSFTYPGWTWRLYITTGTQRSSNGGSGTRSVNQVNNGTSVSFSLGVSASASTVSARIGAWFDGDGQTYANKTLNIPTLGSPAGTTSVDSFTLDSINVRNNVTSWGANATPDTASIDIANNAAFTGFWGASVSDNVPHTFGSLTPNTRYWMRGWQKNGGGKSAYSNTVDAVTLSGVYDDGTIEVGATTYDVTGAKVYQGYYTTSSKLQYRVKGDPTWLDSTPAAGDDINLSITGLLPNTTYERRFVTTTTAGTIENSIVEFTTLSAAKLIMPDGTVKNAVPYTISPGGVKEMVKVKVL